MWFLLACREPGDGPGDDPGSSPATSPAPVDPDVDSFLPPDFLSATPTRVVFFGDSIAAGYGVRDPRDRWVSLVNENRDQRYPELVGRDLETLFGPLASIDVSRGGATTDTVVGDQLPQVAAEVGAVAAGHTLVMGTIGGNDLLDGVFTGDLDGTIDRLLANLGEISAFFSDPVRFPDGASLAITNVYEPTDGTGQAAECFYGLDLAGVIEEYEGLAADSRAQAEVEGWAWIDLAGHFRGHGFNHDEAELDLYDADDPTLWFQDDCIHPNERGHHEVRRLFLAAIEGEPLRLEEGRR